ncbi:MAG: diflavin flavoprotein A, partial [Synechococcaceae cyanobacterium SM2_3_60]|nr:diflavin flavoprotein A [Synechococcaceae cyanobacterium SM2_3_60]
SEHNAKAEKVVAIFYEADYGEADRLANAIAMGVDKTGVAVELVDLAHVDASEVREWSLQADAVVIGMPCQSGLHAAHTEAMVDTVLAAMHPKQTFGLFESAGADDRSIYLLRNGLQESGAREAFPPIVIKEGVTTATDQLCSEAGTDMGQWLTRDKSIKQMKSLDGDLDKALGRISGGLYIITAQKDAAASAMLASWVMQASSEPPGISIAVAKDRAIESLMRVGDRFVLNVLEEGNHLDLMKHFLKRFAPGADRFEGVKTQPASNGAPILTEALAYLECTVISRLETADHWVVYSTVDVGRVANADARTAVHHRKVGNHY